MSSHLVDGVAVPDRVAGHLGLELCNTRAGWESLTPREYLTDDHALAVWAIDAGLLTASVTDPSARAHDRFAFRARAFREALYACALARGTTADWDVLGHAAAQARTRATLRPGVDGAGATWCLAGDLGRTPAQAAEAALHAAALAAEDLLRSPLAATVAACPGQGCGWLFTDPRRRRRWCSMAVCGNRAKARRHAERRAR
jgi:predicted RNA-binding Zn ribbon-like protein